MTGFTTGKRLLLGLLILSAISLFLPLPSPLQVVFGFLQAFYLPGIVFLAFFGDPERTRFDSLFFPPLLSPVILILLVLLTHWFTGSFNLSVRISLIALYILLVIAILAGKFRREDKPSVVPGILPIISLVFIAIIVASYIVNDFLFYHDTSRHSAVVKEILYRGIPPMEPFFIDIPIRSMWFQHLFQAIWKTLSGLSIIHSMWLVNLIGIAIFPYLIARLTSLFTNRRSFILATPFFALAGLDAVYWILWPLNLLRAFTGEVRGSAEIMRIIGRLELDSRFIVSTLRPPMAHALSLLDKYLTIDVLHFSINLFLLCFILVLSRDFQKRFPFRAAAQILLVMTGAFLIRIVTGFALVSAAVLAGIVTILMERLKYGRKPPLFQSLVIPGLAVLVTAAGLNVYKSLTGSFADGMFIPNRVTFNILSLGTIIAPLIVLLPFSWRALKETFTSYSFEYKTLSAWIVSLFILSITIDTIGLTESYFIYPLFLFLIGPVTWQIIHRISTAGGKRRVLIILWITVLFAVPPVLTVRGYMRHKPKIRHHAIRYRITGDERALYDWIKNETGINAIIAERNEYNVMPYYANRRNFYMTTFERYNFGYISEKAERYREIRDEMFSGREIAPETIEFLRGFEFDIYIVVWAEDTIEVPDLDEQFASHPEWFERTYENPAGKVYVLKR